MPACYLRLVGSEGTEAQLEPPPPFSLMGLCLVKHDSKLTLIIDTDCQLPKADMHAPKVLRGEIRFGSLLIWRTRKLDAGVCSPFLAFLG